MKNEESDYFYGEIMVDVIDSVETKAFRMELNLNHLETTKDKIERINHIQSILTEILIDSILTDDQDKNNSDD